MTTPTCWWSSAAATHDRADDAPAVRHHGARVLGAARSLVRQSAATIHGRDIVMVAAGLTFYAGIAIVPIALLLVRSATLLSSPAEVAHVGAQWQLLVPDATGARPVLARLVEAGSSLSPVGVLVALFPASFYGEGVRRAGLRLVPRPDRFTGWRARVAFAPVALLLPVVAAAMIALADPLGELARRGGVWPTLAHIAITFHLAWLVVGVALTWLLRAVAPGRPSWTAAVAGGFATSAVIAGFLHGFLLFLALPLDLGAPFGGLTVIGGVVAVGLWLLVLHLLLLLGWTATTALDDRLRAGRGPATAEAEA